jgi:hypothetical protein
MLKRAAGLVLAAAVLSSCAALSTPVSAAGDYSAGTYGRRLASVSRSGDYCADLVNVALSQVGYHEGSDNGGLDGTEYWGGKNYTRYGQLFGINNSWCAMFASWCARTAGIPANVLNNATMAVAASGSYAFHVPFYSRGTYMPKPGDLIFFRHPGYHVGIVAQVSEDRIVTVEGNSTDAVRMNVYSPCEPTISGYGVYSKRPAADGLIKFDGAGLVRLTIMSEDGVFGKWPDGESTYKCNNYWGLMYREVTVPKNLFVRDGYSLDGYYLYRADDGKWLTDNGWQTGFDAVTNKYELKIFANGQTFIPDASWREGCDGAYDFILCPLWKAQSDGAVCSDRGAPFCGRFDSAGWFCTMGDIDEGDWCYEGVKYDLQNSVFSGASPWRFSPQAGLTRGMLVCLLYDLAGSPALTDPPRAFSDVPSDAWYYNAVQWAAASGAASGRGADAFAPGDIVTRQEFLTMLRSFDREAAKPMSAKAPASDAVFADEADIAAWADEPVRWACDNGLVSGWTEGGGTYIRPQDPVTRAQAAVMLYRYRLACSKA